MADQTYNLTQTGAEVQAIINDANGVKGAGATTSLTTDYIMLKDTSGAYHKIQKSSFTEAVRNILASLLVNNDKGTTISQIAAISSGDFGSVTPANLASVLGGLRFDGKAHSPSEDLDSFKTPGSYFFLIRNDGGPLNYGGLMLVFDFGIYRTLQLVFPVQGNTKDMYFRVYNKTDSSWFSWVQVSTSFVV